MEQDLEEEREQDLLYTPAVSPVSSPRRSSELLNLDNIQPGQVYSLPNSQEDWWSNLSPCTRKKAESLHLPEYQEFMRIPVARALVKSPPKKGNKKGRLWDKLRGRKSHQ